MDRDWGKILAERTAHAREFKKERGHFPLESPTLDEEIRVMRMRCSTMLLPVLMGEAQLGRTSFVVMTLEARHLGDGFAKSYEAARATCEPRFREDALRALVGAAAVARDCIREHGLVPWLCVDERAELPTTLIEWATRRNYVLLATWQEKVPASVEA